MKTLATSISMVPKNFPQRTSGCWLSTESGQNWCRQSYVWGMTSKNFTTYDNTSRLCQNYRHKTKRATQENKAHLCKLLWIPAWPLHHRTNNLSTTYFRWTISWGAFFCHSIGQSEAQLSSDRPAPPRIHLYICLIPAWDQRWWSSRRCAHQESLRYAIHRVYILNSSENQVMQKCLSVLGVFFRILTKVVTIISVSGKIS